MSHRDPVNDTVQVRVRNSVRNAPFPLLNLIANTGPITTQSQTLFNLESAASYGRFTVSGEYTVNMLDGASVGTGPNLGTLVYQGFYAQSMVFLTGEHREWDPKLGMFKRVIPLRNFSPKEGGWGAWEVGTRYTYLNLDDKGVNGGRLSSVTLGSTWYWNPNVRKQFNYDYLYRDAGSNPVAKGAVHALGTRLALDFQRSISPITSMLPTIAGLSAIARRISPFVRMNPLGISPLEYFCLSPKVLPEHATPAYHLNEGNE
jgi:phosphate-selective porin OprO and OprP